MLQVGARGAPGFLGQKQWTRMGLDRMTAGQNERHFQFQRPSLHILLKSCKLSRTSQPTSNAQMAEASALSP